MAGVPITDLPTVTSNSAADVFPIVQSGVTSQIAFANVTGLTQYATGGASTGSALVGFLQSGTGAVARTVQSKERERIDVTDFGTIGGGTGSDTAVFANAIAACPAGGEVVMPKGSTAYFATTLTIDRGITLRVLGTIKPLSNASVAGTPLITITSSDVAVIFQANGGIDGISSSYSNWNGIYAEGTSDMLSDISVIGGKFRNIAIDNTSAQVINMTGVKNPIVDSPDIRNCGVIGNVSGGGEMVYFAFCENPVLKTPYGDTCGSSFVNSSANLNFTCEGGYVKNATLFGYKGGYGTGISVSNDAAPTSTTFTVTKNTASKKQLKAGQAFCIPRATYPLPKGVIKSLTDNGNYYTVTTFEAMAANPIAAEGIQMLDTNATFNSPGLLYSGDNGVDYNGFRNLHVNNPRFTGAGLYTAVGTFASFGAAVWGGYDPQGGNTAMDSDGFIVTDPEIESCKGMGVCCFVTNDVRVSGGYIRDWNRAGTATYNAVDINRLGYHTQARATIDQVEVTGGGAGRAYYVGLMEKVNITPKIDALNGIKLSSTRYVVVKGGQIHTTSATAKCIEIADDSGGNPASAISIDEVLTNVGSNTGAYNIHVTDASATAIEIGDNNNYYGTATYKVWSDATSSTSQVPYGGYGGFRQAKDVHLSTGVGATNPLGVFFADNGTGSSMTVQGTAWKTDTSASETFQVVFYGHTGSASAAFTSIGATGGGAFLAAGDFTTSFASSKVTCNYTNNEAVTVKMTLNVSALGRF